jgi:hypothetical protein
MGEYTLGVDWVVRGFFPESGIERLVKGLIDLEARVEVVVTNITVFIADIVGDLHEELGRNIRDRHREGDGVGVGVEERAVERMLARRVVNNLVITSRGVNKYPA